MRIESMDAALKQTVSIAPSQVKQESSIDSTKLTASRGKDTDKEYAKEEKYTSEELSNAFVEKAINKANYTFEIQNRSLRFKIHERLNEVMVKVIDSETEEVIREIPPEKLLDMFANMLELAGLLVDERR
ncbi:MAG: flagellar protein FlaG [Acetivibrionales bacterium]